MLGLYRDNGKIWKLLDYYRVYLGVIVGNKGILCLYNTFTRFSCSLLRTTKYIRP